jgi:hypothetical protein
MNRNVTGFYHDPPLFLVEYPMSDEGKVLHFDRFDEDILRTKLGGGLEMRATVEGLFAFDFSAIADCKIPGNEDGAMDDFNAIAEAMIRRTRIMNAYLAFFYTHQILVDHRGQDRMVVTPDLTISMHSLNKDSGQGFGSQRVSHLSMSRFESTYIQTLPYSMDDRISMRGGPVSEEVVQSAAADLSVLIENQGDEGVLLVDLFLRASKAFQDHNHSLSLISYWTIIERLVNDLWMQMQEDYKSHQGATFIDGARRKRLKDGRTFTASVMSEMLSFLDYISKDLYDDISATRKVRNDWMHDLKSVDAKEAMLANSVCERLLKQVKGLTLIGATGLKLHG